REGKKTAWPQQACRLGNGTQRIAEAHCPPVAEDDVEAGVRQRNILSAGFDERKIYAGLLHETTSMLKLPRRDIQAHRSRSTLCQRNRPASRPAAKLQDILARYLAENMQFRLWNAP